MITFGTDGWRDIIADNFTFANLRLAAQAVADYLLEENQTPLVIVGHDTRFLSRGFAKSAAEVLAARGIKVMITTSFAPTPAVSYAVVQRHAQGGIVITASHNPAKYNGFKFKAAYGGSATSDIMDKIETKYLSNLKAAKQPAVIDFNTAVKSGAIELFDPEPDYFAKLNSLLDVSVFSGNKTRVLIDPLFGAGQGYLKRFIESRGCLTQEIHNSVLPTFGGLNPEPIEPNLSELKKSVVAGNFDLGLALDGDADRIGAVDERGNFVNSHQIFSLILKHLVEQRGWRGQVIKTVSTTQMVDRLAKKYELSLIETPIGFKYICDHMLSGDVLIGGEESGGISIKGHIPERDGLLMGSLIIEVMLTENKKLSQLLAELSDEAGPAYYDRIDKEITPGEKDKIISWFKSREFNTICDRKIIGQHRKDGFKFFFKDGSWLLFRPSGTEPVIRLYAEAESSQEVKFLLENGIGLMRQAITGDEI